LSNCISFHNQGEGVLFPNKVLRKEALEQALQKIQGRGKPEADIREEHTEEEVDQYHYWWFLEGTSDLTPEGFLVRFGHGRSGHTWRDWRNTLWFLHQFVEKPFAFTVYLSDEYDGHDSVGPFTVRMPYPTWEELVKEV